GGGGGARWRRTPDQPEDDHDEQGRAHRRSSGNPFLTGGRGGWGRGRDLRRQQGLGGRPGWSQPFGPAGGSRVSLLSPIEERYGLATAAVFTADRATGLVHWQVGGTLLFFSPIVAFLVAGLGLRRVDGWRGWGW